MSIEETVRQIVQEEMGKASGRPTLQSVEDFCDEVGLSRVTLWRQEKQGKVKIHRIGKRCFVNPQEIAR